MFRKGSMLLQILIMLFFIGIMLITIFSLVSSSGLNSNRIRRHDELIYIGEMVIEKLKSRSDNMVPIIMDLDNIGKVYYEDEDFDNEMYKVILSKLNNNPSILEFIIRVESKNEHNPQYVEFKASIPKS